MDERRDFIRGALHGYEATRANTQHGAGETDAAWHQARAAAAAIKWEAIEGMDQHLEMFCERLEARGTKVHWASTGPQAVEYIRWVLKENGARSVVKSKAMTSEEIHLNAALIEDGYEVVESDLGEFIVQLNQEAPYHFVFPSMHLKRGEIQALFARELDLLADEKDRDDPEVLTSIARRVLRQQYLKADVGISGANFGIAETGMISITENEGNARLTTALPKIHIAVMGIEKVIPRLDDLALLLPMLATAGTGQHLTGYNSMLGGPRQPGESDGPEQMHVVLLDNRRTELLADPEQRDALRCIRCGACLNVCPVFKNVGGFSYGTTYQGPIGSVITPHLRGLDDWAHLSGASSLCGACTETCPVQIDLHHHLLRNRRNAYASKPGFRARLGFRCFSIVMRRRWLYRFAVRWRGAANLLPRRFHGKRIDPLRAWRQGRTLPVTPKQTFKSWWDQHTS